MLGVDVVSQDQVRNREIVSTFVVKDDRDTRRKLGDVKGSEMTVRASPPAGRTRNLYMLTCIHVKIEITLHRITSEVDIEDLYLRRGNSPIQKRRPRQLTKWKIVHGTTPYGNIRFHIVVFLA